MRLRCCVVASIALIAASAGWAEGRADAPYDPLARAAGSPAHLDLVVRDPERKRSIPIRVYLPPTRSAAPVVLFSHGLGGARTTCAYLGEHWAARGYVAVFLQHPGSDESVWKDRPLLVRMAAMKAAASARNFLLRVQDVGAVLDQLVVWDRDAAHPLHGRMDLTRIGMSGHSFGAVTTQAVSGESFPLIGQRYTDPRIKAAIAFSPSAPKRGSASRAFGAVKIPWMLMTGTRDNAPIGGASAASRLEVYRALPPGDKYELVLFDAEHSAFTERALPGDRVKRNPNHHRAILALSTAFWDATLRGDPAARRWLEGGGARSVLEPRDRWQHK